MAGINKHPCSCCQWDTHRRPEWGRWRDLRLLPLQIRASQLPPGTKVTTPVRPCLPRACSPLRFRCLLSLFVTGTAPGFALSLWFLYTLPTPL